MPRWVPVILALGLGTLLGLLVADEAWFLLLALTLIVPAVVIFNHYPFAVVIVWLVVVPFFQSVPGSDQRLLFWLLHRILLPATLVLTILANWLGVVPYRRLRTGAGRTVGMPFRQTRAGAKFGSAEVAMLLFFGLALANISSLSSDPADTAMQLYDLVFVPFSMYLLLRFTAPDEKDIKRLLWAAFFALMVQIIIGVLSRFAPAILPPEWTQLEERTVGSLMNAAVYSSTLILLTLLLFQYAMNSTSSGLPATGREAQPAGTATVLRRLMYVVLGGTMFSVFITFSRGSWLGGILVLIGLVLLYPRTMIRLSVVVTVLVAILSSSILAEEITFGYSRLTSFEAQRSAANRVISNQASISMIQARPAWGWGFGSYDVNYMPFVRRVGDIPITEGYDVTSHNTFLTIAAEMGLVAFLLYLYPVFRWLVASAKVWRRLPAEGFISRRLLAMLWLVMLHMFIVMNFMDMIRFYPFGTTIWWMTLALIAIVVQRYQDQEEPGTRIYHQDWTGFTG